MYLLSGAFVSSPFTRLAVMNAKLEPCPTSGATDDIFSSSNAAGMNSSKSGGGGGDDLLPDGEDMGDDEDCAGGGARTEELRRVDEEIENKVQYTLYCSSGCYDVVSQDGAICVDMLAFV